MLPVLLGQRVQKPWAGVGACTNSLSCSGRGAAVTAFTFGRSEDGGAGIGYREIEHLFSKIPAE